MSIDQADVTITHHDEGGGGKYVAKVAGETATGHLEWEPRQSSNGDAIRIATHTIVPREIGGRGVAGHLVDRFVADAREHGFKIVPQCSYVEKKFDENPGWADLRA